jgi:hypothetical protein
MKVQKTHPLDTPVSSPLCHEYESVSIEIFSRNGHVVQSHGFQLLFMMQIEADNRNQDVSVVSIFASTSKLLDTTMQTLVEPSWSKSRVATEEIS